MLPLPEEARPAVLVVEDDRDIADSLGCVLEQERFSVELVGEGPAALAAVEARIPDLILLDLMLPGLDGVAVAAELQRRAGRAAQIPLVLFSAGRQLEREAGRVGTPYFLRKPFDVDDLLRILRRALHERRAPMAPLA